MGTFFQKNSNLVEIMYWGEIKQICPEFSPEKILSVTKICHKKSTVMRVVIYHGV
jgi:hypothetical protein